MAFRKIDPLWDELFPAEKEPLVLALARAYRWQPMIDSGAVPGVEAIAAQHRVGWAYMSRIVGLAALAPDLTQAALRGDEPGGLSLRRLPGGRLRVGTSSVLPFAAEAHSPVPGVRPRSASRITSGSSSLVHTSAPSMAQTGRPGCILP